jgi:hypothetical protein
MLFDFLCWIESFARFAGDSFDYVGSADALLRSMYSFLGAQ